MRPTNTAASGGQAPPMRSPYSHSPYSYRTTGEEVPPTPLPPPQQQVRSSQPSSPLQGPRTPIYVNPASGQINRNAFDASQQQQQQQQQPGHAGEASSAIEVSGSSPVRVSSRYRHSPYSPNSQYQAVGGSNSHNASSLRSGPGGNVNQNLSAFPTSPTDNSAPRSPFGPLPPQSSSAFAGGESAPSARFYGSQSPSSSYTGNSALRVGSAPSQLPPQSPTASPGSPPGYRQSIPGHHHHHHHHHMHAQQQQQQQQGRFSGSGSYRSPSIPKSNQDPFNGSTTQSLPPSSTPGNAQSQDPRTPPYPTNKNSYHNSAVNTTYAPNHFVMPPSAGSSTPSSPQPPPPPPPPPPPAPGRGSHPSSPMMPQQQRSGLSSPSSPFYRNNSTPSGSYGHYPGNPHSNVGNFDPANASYHSPSGSYGHQHQQGMVGSGNFHHALANHAGGRGGGHPNGPTPDYATAAMSVANTGPAAGGRQQLGGHSGSPLHALGGALASVSSKTASTMMVEETSSSSVHSCSSASSVRDDLPLCPNDDACALINDRKHQRKFAHTCRLFPCYHGHITRHAKLFRHAPGQISQPEGVNTTKMSTLALTSVTFTTISPEAPNAYRIYVAHGDKSYEIFGDWASVKIHTFKRYLHQVYHIPPSSQILMVMKTGKLMDDDISSVKSYGIEEDSVIQLKNETEMDGPARVPIDDL